MRYQRLAVASTILIVETAIQCLYLGVKIKYYQKYHTYDTFGSILAGRFYFFGSVKNLLGAVIYGILYQSIDASQVAIKIAAQHLFCFLILLLLMFCLFMQPSNKLLDIGILCVISFFCSFFIIKTIKSKAKKIFL